MRDDDAAWIAAWEPETEEWSLLGLPLADVDGMWVYAIGGTVYAIGVGDPDSCEDPAAPFSNPPADALLGDSQQIASVESGLVWPAGLFVQLDGQRVCAMWIAGEERVVLDLEDGDQLVFPIAPVGYPRAGWIDE